MPITRVHKGIRVQQYQTRNFPVMLLAQMRLLSTLRPARWMTLEEVFNDAVERGVLLLAREEKITLPPDTAFGTKPQRTAKPLGSTR